MGEMLKHGGLSRRSFLKGAALGLAGAGAVGAALPLAACSAGSGGAAATGEATASATVPGFGGDVTVELTVDRGSGSVVAATIDAPMETPNRGGRAATVMQEAMAENATIDVDAVSGATVTSEAIKSASVQAYNEAIGAAEDASSAVMKPGTYTGYAKGYWQIWEIGRAHV